MMSIFSALIACCYSSITILFGTAVGWRYLHQKSIQLSWHLWILVASLPLCYYLLDSIGVAVFAIVSLVVYGYLPTPSLDVGNKAVLITGCDSGFGHATAKHLDSLGFQVFAGCLVKGGKGEQQLINNCSGQLTTLQLDVTKQEQIDEAFHIIKEKLDGKGLWGLVNNAGIHGIINVELQPIHVFQKVWNVNCLGAIRMIKKYLPLIRKSRGRIVNLSSFAGRFPFVGASAYCISKAGVEMLSDVLRQEMKDLGVSVSIIEPGAFKTEISEKSKIDLMYRDIMEDLDDEIKMTYDIEKQRSRMDVTKDADSGQSTDLSPVTGVIQDALLSKHPKSRYPIGQRGGTFIWLANHVPSVILDRVLPAFSLDLYLVRPRKVQ
ncbi:retinol dehydrogenase 7-like [Ptychodera flava]|uniref:retinol dehydrogenase 7-like n=1 Tax=Ptychodera flava TaxID=63121 RepID=UPI00396A9B24